MPALPDRIAALLNQHTTLVMASSRGEQPWIGSVFYAPEIDGAGVRLTCAILASSRKLANLRANPRVAVYIGPKEPTCWLQAEGRAIVLDREGEREAALACLTAHAPAANMFVSRVPVVAVTLILGRARLTDLTGGRPPVLEWTGEQAVT